MKTISARVAVIIVVVLSITLFISPVSHSESTFSVDPELLKFCATVTSTYARNSNSSSATSNSSDVNAGATVPIKGVPVGGDFGSSSTSTSQKVSMDQILMEYESKQCEVLLEQVGLVTIAEINANRDIAIQRLRLQESKYKYDTQKDIELIWSDVARHSIDTQYNANVVTNSSIILNTNAQGILNYLMIDRQAQSIENQGAIRDNQIHTINKQIDTENQLKAKQKY